MTANAILSRVHVNHLICIFMNINEILKRGGKIIKNINKLISASKHHQTTIVATFFITYHKYHDLISPFILSSSGFI